MSLKCVSIFSLLSDSCYCCSLAKSCPTLFHPMDCSKPGFPIPHHIPEFAQIHVHWISDAIQPSHPLSPSSSSAFNLFQHQGLFQWVSSLHQIAKVLELQYQPFQWIFRVDFLKDWLVWSPCTPGDSQGSFPPLQFESIRSLAFSLPWGPTLTSIHDYWKSNVSAF